MRSCGRSAGSRPPEVVTIVTEQIVKIANSNAGGLLTFAFLFTLWSSSSAVVSMITTLNAAYDITEGRAWWKVRLIAIAPHARSGVLHPRRRSPSSSSGPTLAEQVADAMHLGAAFEWTWKILQWPLVFALVATAIAIVYYFAPDAEQDWVWITPGAAFATLLWIAASLGFKFYLLYFGSYNETYGTIGGVMVLLLWFYRVRDRDPDRRGAECRDRARLPVRQGAGRESAGREEEDRRRRRAVLRRVQSDGTREVTLNCAGCAGPAVASPRRASTHRV